MLTRRELLRSGTGLALAGLLAGCGSAGLPIAPGGADESAALRARPGRPSEPLPPPGRTPLGLAPQRDAVLHLPPGPPAGQPLPLLVNLHGAGGDAEAGLGLAPLADEHGFALLAPASRQSTWDAVLGRYGSDVELLDRALDRVFRAVPVDPARIAVAGFSDGASYALGLGLANGRLFGRVVAFSPGFVPPARREGEPAVFVSHGDDDDVLPVGRTSRRIVPELREDGYDVTYKEFDGPHVLPPEIAAEAIGWLGWS